MGADRISGGVEAKEVRGGADRVSEGGGPRG